jgi:Fe-S cluster assembly protein SufD
MHPRLGRHATFSSHAITLGGLIVRNEVMAEFCGEGGECTLNGLYLVNGKIIVAPDAQKTDAKQTNKALLLSEHAQINTKPELEIFADDVRCTHGATIGQLDADALFYLRARGLGEEHARRVLVHAFASDLLNRIAIEPIRDQLDTVLLQQLPGSNSRMS